MVGSLENKCNKFHLRLYGKLVDIKGNLRRLEFHRMNHGSTFLGSSFTNRDNTIEELQSNLEENNNPPF